MTTGRRYLQWFLGLLAFELVSWLAFSLTVDHGGWASPMGGAFLLTGLISGWLAWRRPVLLAWLTVAELVIGGQGYLLFFEINGEKLSLRLLLFLILMVAWVLRLVGRRWRVLPWSRPALLLLGWVGVMSVVGWARGFGVGAVFTDMNGYLYAGIVFPWWYFLRQTTNWRAHLTVVLLSGVTIVGLKSWTMQLLFAQNFDTIVTVYRWIRQTGVGEITLISQNVFRIFFQSQIYALLGLVLILASYAKGQARPWWTWALLGSSIGVYVSLSRSLWLGLGVALVAFVMLMIIKKEWRPIARLSILLPTAAFVWLMTTWALNFPYIIPPPGQPSNGDAVVARLKSAGSQQASTARANQIPPLLSAITKNPITGHGFGATLTYQSTDPRIRGSRTTSAFELGYLDMLFHFGLVGLGLLGWWAWAVVRRLWRHPLHSIWIWPSIGLAAVHLTSPYLNHPLGLGWLALITLMAYDPE